MKKLVDKNDIIKLEITAFSHEGSGIGRHCDMVVFVPMSSPGDVLSVRVVKALSSHAYGIIEEILSPSPLRVENECPVYKRCGGCSLRHISYGAEMKIKEGWARENLRRIGGVEPPFDAPLPSRFPDRYRNKAQFPIRRMNGSPAAGFFARRSHELVPVSDCLLQPRVFKVITSAFLEFMKEYGIECYDEKNHTGLVRHLYLRLAGATGQVMVCAVINGTSMPHAEELVGRLRGACPDVSAVSLDINRRRGNSILGASGEILYGKGYITDILCGMAVNISPGSFYQVNREGAEVLYSKALEYASPKPSDTLLDLYCGTGTIGLSMAGRVGKVIGVERVEASVINARENAAANGILNADFYLSEASEAARSLKLSPGIVILDPPRKGADRETLDSVALMSPERIVYISCDSATLARDCSYLSQRGYRAVRAAAADLFPRTAHVECVVLLVKS